MKIFLNSQNETLIKINDSSYLIGESEIFFCADEDFVALVYPILNSKIFIPYSAKFTFKKGQLICENDNVKIINYNSFAEVFFEPFCLQQKAPVKINSFNFEAGGLAYMVEVYKNCLENLVITNGQTTFSHTTMPLSECAIYKIENFVVLSCCGEKNYILIFNITKNELELEVEASQFEISYEKKELTFLKPLHDSLTHAQVFKFSLNGKLEIIDEFTTYLSETEAYSNLVAELVFFDCIKAKNFKKARQFLSTDLNQNVSNSALENYFLPFCEIKKFDEDNLYLIPKGKNVCAARLKIEKTDNLINNINILYN